MGQFLDEIPEYLFEWIMKQQMFWVASAPLSADGHINISPKGIEGTFHVVNSRKVWYQDLSGSGAETVAHIRENGRVTILFHAFEGPARIVRLYGKGFFHQIGSPEYEAMLPVEDRIPGSRAVIGLDVTKVCTTCGYAVPYYQFIGHRSQLIDWAERKEVVDIKDAKASPVASSSSPTAQPSSSSTSSSSAPWMERVNPNGMIHWWQTRNLRSIDGLPSFLPDLGIGFPFNFGAHASRAPGLLKPSPRLTQSKRTRSSSRVFTEVNSISRPEQPQSRQFAIQVMSTEGKGDARDVRELAAWIVSYFPLVVALLFGTLLGRWHQQYVLANQGLAIP